MKCQRCKTAESTGTIMALCDACFSWFEEKLASHPGQYKPTDEELEYFNAPFIKRVN